MLLAVQCSRSYTEYSNSSILTLARKRMQHTEEVVVKIAFIKASIILTATYTIICFIHIRGKMLTYCSRKQELHLHRKSAIAYHFFGRTSKMTPLTKFSLLFCYNYAVHAYQPIPEISLISGNHNVINIPRMYRMTQMGQIRIMRCCQ